MTPNTQTKVVEARHNFTVEETLKIKDEMIAAVGELACIESEFDSSKAAFKSRIAQAETTRDDLYRKLRDGFEMRPTKAVIFFNDPQPGRKTLRAAHNGAFIREEQMTQADEQRPLFVTPDGTDATDPEAIKTVEFPPKDDALPEPIEEETGLTGEESPTACTPGGEDAGTTPMGEALAQAAILGHDDAECPVFAFNPRKYAGVNKLVKAFVGGAHRAGWPDTAIDVIVTELKRCDTESQMMEIMKAHTHNPEEAE